VKDEPPAGLWTFDVSATTEDGDTIAVAFAQPIDA
jgi:hypothetical protein